MKPIHVLVADHSGRRRELIACEVRESTAYVTSETNHRRINRGEESLPLIGFPFTSVFYLDGSRFAVVDGARADRALDLKDNRFRDATI